MTESVPILVATGDPRLAESLGALLGDHGLTARTAADAQAAAASLRGCYLAVIDVDLPGGGVQLATRIKKASPDFRVILTSMQFRALSDSQWRALPADAFISHPFPFYEMSEAVLDLLKEGSVRPQESKTAAQLPMRGALGDYPFEVLLFKLFDARFTGRLALQLRKTKKVLYFLRGFPSAATSNIHTEALGTLLVNRGVIQMGELNAILGSMKEGQSLGERLIEVGMLSVETLRETLDEQVRERVLSCFETRDGEWAVYPGENFVHQLDHFVQNPIELIYLGISRFEETNTLAEKVQSRADHNVVPTRNFVRLLPFFPMGYNRRALLSRIDGQRTVGELFRAWNGDLPAFFRYVWALQATRLVFLSPSPIPTPVPPIETLLRPMGYLGTFLSLRLQRRSEHLSTSFQHLLTAKQARPLAALLNLGPRIEELNHFELMGITPMATPLEVRAAVEERMKLFDPTVLRTLPPDELSQITQIGRRLKAAASVLLDPEARERYRLEVAPELGAVDVEDGTALLNKGKVQEAHDLFAALEAANPANSRAAAMLGRCLYLMAAGRDQGKLGQAGALLRRAIALDEGYAEGHYFLAELLFTLGDNAEALALLDKVIELDPEHQEARNLRARFGRSVGLETIPLGTLREAQKQSS